MSETHEGVVDRPEGDAGGHDHRGMKLLRIWVPDPAAPEFRAEAKRQAELLRGCEEQEEALRFIEAVTDWPEEP